MSTIDRLKRLTGEGSDAAAAEKEKGGTRDRIGELRSRIDAILFRRPQPPERPAPAATGRRRALEDLVPGREEATPWGTCFSVEGRVAETGFHGCRFMDELAAVDMERLALLGNEPRLARCSPGDGLFLDTETTGLSGGTGTVAFLIGAGWFDGEDFRTVQIFARDFEEERAALFFLRDLVRDRRFLVTFNGKAFDLGVLSARFVLNRLPDPLSSLPHLDLLHPARRLFRHRLESCRLASLEENLLRFRREGDHPGDHLAAARILHDRARIPEARALLEQVAALEGEPALEARRRLSLLYKREALWEEAVRLWGEMTGENPGDPFAVEELAKWYEHRAKDCGKARALVLQALDTAPPDARPALRRRLERLTRKTGAARPDEGSYERRGNDPMKKKIRMYTLSTCSHCKATKRFLTEHDITFDFTDVDLLGPAERAAVLEEVKGLNPRLSFPTIVIGDTVIVGFREREIREALGI